MKLLLQLCLISSCLTLVTFKLHAQDDNNLANNLISLRGEVEDLQSELKILKSEHQNSMSYLNTKTITLKVKANSSF